MTQRLKPLKPRVIIKTLQHIGFEQIRQRGSHIYFRHPDGRATVVPYHKGEDLSKGILKKILQDIELTWEDFLKLL